MLLHLVFVGLVACAVLFASAVSADLPHKPPPGPIDWVVELLDASSSPSAFLFRGDLPLLTDSAFNYAGLLSAMREKTSQLPTDDDKIYLIDISFTYDSWPDNPFWVSTERNFFTGNTSRGAFNHWPLYGDWRDPNDYSPAIKERDAITLSRWQMDSLVSRVEQVRAWFVAGPPAGYEAVAIYFHCETGVDRTGEFAVSYGTRYLNESFQGAMTHADDLCTKVNGRPVMPMMAFAAEWYCWYLFYELNFDHLQCHLPDVVRKQQSAPVRPETVTIPLRLMTYNIRHGSGLDGKLDLKRTGFAIAQEKVDAVALQEVDNATTRVHGIEEPKELAALAGLPHYFFDKNRDFMGGGYGTSILTRLEPLDSKSFHYWKPGSASIDTPPDKCQAEVARDYCQGALAVRMNLLHGEIQNFFILVTTHIGLQGVQLNETKQLVEEFVRSLQVAYPALPVIVTGDFNAMPGSDAVKYMQSVSDDMWLKCGKGDGFTFNSATPTERIDFQFLFKALTPAPAVIFKCVDARVPDTQASDHRPLVVDYQWITGV